MLACYYVYNSNSMMIAEAWKKFNVPAFSVQGPNHNYTVSPKKGFIMISTISGTSVFIWTSNWGDITLVSNDLRHSFCT